MAIKKLTLRDSSNVGLLGDDVAGRRYKCQIAGLCPEAESWAVQDFRLQEERIPVLRQRLKHASREELLADMGCQVVAASQGGPR